MTTEERETSGEFETSGLGAATGAALGTITGALVGSIGTVFGSVVGGSVGAIVGASLGALGDLVGKTAEEVAIFSWSLFKAVFEIQDGQSSAVQGGQTVASTKHPAKGK